MYFSFLVYYNFALAFGKRREESRKQRGMAVVRHQIKEKVRMTSKKERGRMRAQRLEQRK